MKTGRWNRLYSLKRTLFVSYFLPGFVTMAVTLRRRKKYQKAVASNILW
jgi:hypothetical protein